MFWKKDNKKEDKKENKKLPEAFHQVDAEEKPDRLSEKMLPNKYGVLKGFYISEKSSVLNSFGQYVFKVFDNATKNEIKKHVEKGFGVKIKGVKIINLPKKARKVGRHSGFKPGFKKAIVVLKEGYTIEQAKP